MEKKYYSLEGLNQRLENEGFFVEENLIEKNNVTMQGLVVHKIGVEGNVFPTIYADNFDNEDDLYRAICGAYTREVPNVDMNEVLTKDFVVSHLVAEVVSLSSGIVKKLVHRPICDDLAVIYKLVLFKNGNENATVSIDEKMLNEIGMTEEDLFEIVSKSEEFDIVPMGDIIRSMMGEDEIADVTPGYPMYVVTSQNHLFGASVLCSKFLNRISEKVGDEYIILPSSIYEVIVLPKGVADYESLLEMVISVNATQVEPTEKLTDSVYSFSVANGLQKVA